MLFKKFFSKLNRQQMVPLKNEYQLNISNKIEDNIETIKGIVGESDDILHREFLIGNRLKAALFYVNGLCDSDNIKKNVIETLMYNCKIDRVSFEDFLKYIRDEVITLSEIAKETSIDNSIIQLLSGETILMIDGFDEFLILKTRKYKERNIAEPTSEIVVKGPRDGFVESLHTNIMQVRRRIRDPNLTVQFGNLGRRSKSDYAILFIKGVTSEELIKEVKYRISCVDNDHIIDTGSLEEYIEDNVLSPFPEMIRSERVDRTVSALMAGQFVILHDGSPFSLMGPVTFHMLFRSPEDYYERWHIGTLIRMLRFAAAFIAIFLPAIYIAVTSYHQGMIPTTLALSMSGSREGVPFPVFVEAIAMEFTIELLREAGVRLPRAVGQTIGIVGGLVIGDAAVQAGLVSPIMVIVVALTAIASFSLPTYSISITLRILRFVMMISAALFGLYGILIAYIFINIHLVGLRSFGTYYTAPLAPIHFKEWKDLFVRAPLHNLKERFSEIKPQDKKRQR